MAQRMTWKDCNGRKHVAHVVRVVQNGVFGVLDTYTNCFVHPNVDSYRWTRAEAWKALYEFEARQR